MSTLHMTRLSQNTCCCSSGEQLFYGSANSLAIAPYFVWRLAISGSLAPPKAMGSIPYYISKAPSRMALRTKRSEGMDLSCKYPRSPDSGYIKQDILVVSMCTTYGLRGGQHLAPSWGSQVSSSNTSSQVSGPASIVWRPRPRD